MLHGAALERVLSIVNYWACTIPWQWAQDGMAVVMEGDVSLSPDGDRGGGLALRSEPRVQGTKEEGV